MTFFSFLIVPAPSSSCSHGSTTALNSLNLLDGPDRTAEAGGELVTVEVHTLAGQDGGQSRGRSASYAGLTGADPCLSQGAILLGSLTVLAEGDMGGALGKVGWEGVGGRSRMRLRGVINSSYREGEKND